MAAERSLVDVLCMLAANWARCECGLQIGAAGPDGWKKRTLDLGDNIDLLNVQLAVVDSPPRKAAMQAELQRLEEQSKILDDEWGQAFGEAEEYCELFCDAREFCTKNFGTGDSELFNAALVGFNPERLPSGKGPSKHRITELAMLLSNCNGDKWESQPWAKPAKPTARAVKRVAPDRLESFINQQLQDIETPPVETPPAETPPAETPPAKTPYLGLLIHDDQTVSRQGDYYKDKMYRISLSPQQFKILKFIHGAGEKGRTKDEMDAEGFTSLKQEKTKINVKLIPIDLRLESHKYKLIHTGKER